MAPVLPVVIDMLAKIVAVVLLTLILSPFTAPFSTCDHSRSGMASVDGGAVGPVVTRAGTAARVRLLALGASGALTFLQPSRPGASSHPPASLRIDVRPIPSTILRV